MSVMTEITRITDDRNAIRNKLVSLGLAESSMGLRDLAIVISHIEDNGNVDAEVKEGETYTIPSGWHRGNGTVKGVAGGGNYSLQVKTVTPTKTQQNITPDAGYYGLSGVTVGVIPAAYQDVSSVTASAEDVLVTKVFVGSDGVSTPGSMSNNGALSLTIDGLANTSVSVPAGYTSGGTVSLTSDIEDALAAI